MREAVTFWSDILPQFSGGFHIDQTIQNMAKSQCKPASRTAPDDTLVVETRVWCMVD